MPSITPNLIFGVQCVSLAVGVLLSGCGHSPETQETASEAKEPPILEVATLTVDLQPWPQRVIVQGSLIADEVALVGTEVAGRVENVHVDLGDQVSAGEPLVTLETAEFELQIAQAEAELAQARAAVGLAAGEPVDRLDPLKSPPVREQKASWDEAKTKSQRIKQLYQQNAVTESDLETAIAAEEIAAARYSAALNAVNEKLALIHVRAAALELARQRLKDAVIRAPFDCLVQAKHVSPGNYVQVGQQLITVVRVNPLRFRGTIPERYAQQLRVGQKVTLVVDSTGNRREVPITRISPSLDLRSRALTFEAEVENRDGLLRDGLFTEGEVVLDPKARQIAIPQSAVVEFAGVEKVWKVVDGVSQEQIVETGERRRDGVVIVSGLEPGDVILVDGSAGKVAQIRSVPHQEDTVQQTEVLSDRCCVANVDHQRGDDIGPSSSNGAASAD